MVRGQMPVPTEESQHDVESSSEGEAAAAQQTWWHRGLITTAAACAGVLVICWASVGGQHVGAVQTPKFISARQLLESDALAELATNNMMAMGGARRADGAMMERRELMGQVSESFKNISAHIAARDPMVARQLDELQVSAVQQSAAMGRLHHYSNPVLLKIAGEITAAYEKHHAMHKDIADRVLAHTEDLRAVAEGMFPVRRDETADLPQVTSERRLAAPHVECLRGVAPQARTLLEGLEVELGERMPKAPSRMLFELTSTPPTTATAAPYPASGTSTGTDQQTQGFMDCLTKALPNPIEVCSCMASNMSHVVKMMTNFMSGIMPK